MDTKSNPTGTACRGIEVDDEIIGVLYAISVVSKRLARNLALLERQGERSKEGVYWYTKFVTLCSDNMIYNNIIHPRRITTWLYVIVKTLREKLQEPI